MEKAWGIFQKACVGLTVAGLLLVPTQAASFYKSAATKAWNAVSTAVSSGANGSPSGAQ